MSYYKKLISNPSLNFRTPMEVLLARELTPNEKLKALKNWKNIELHISESEAEGMPPKQFNHKRLLEIDKAIVALRNSY